MGLRQVYYIMKDNNAIKTIRETFIPLATAVLLFLNIWLASKLAPLAQDIAINRVKVLANERTLERFETKLDEALNRICSK